MVSHVYRRGASHSACRLHVANTQGLCCFHPCAVGDCNFLSFTVFHCLQATTSFAARCSPACLSFPRRLPAEEFFVGGFIPHACLLGGVSSTVKLFCGVSSTGVRQAFGRLLVRHFC